MVMVGTWIENGTHGQCCHGYCEPTCESYRGQEVKTNLAIWFGVLSWSAVFGLMKVGVVCPVVFQGPRFTPPQQHLSDSNIEHTSKETKGR